MIIREQSEQNELRSLSGFSAKSITASRVSPETRCDYRTEFQRDRDRIIHSKAFRRLKHKTQVYIAPGDHYRMRMTHSLEVSQIARTIARALLLNEDLVEAIALGHDVGHTPFGHVGEHVLREIAGTFNHNEQSLRVVDTMERGGKGLNLTFEVRDGILNHTGNSTPKTLEGQVVKISDRIAYLCHDFDDSVRAEMLQCGDLPLLVTEILGTAPSKMITVMVSDIINNSIGKADIIQSSQVRQAMDDFRAFMFANVYDSPRLEADRRKARYVIKNLYQYFFEKPELLPEEYVERVQLFGLERTLIDYIAGLTDMYAISLFEQLLVPAKYPDYI
ncbi:MAG: deoxyguanosinetriphosphate triphosphohydrolase [Negativicutes bacterium]|jgi:dGTPase